MPKRKKNTDFLEDIGTFEFDDISVSSSGRLVEENKRVELDFSGFQSGNEYEPDTDGASRDIFNTCSANTYDVDDVDNFQDFEEEDDEQNNMSAHNRRKLRLLSSWRKQRDAMLPTYMKSCCIPEGAVCKICSADCPDFRCNDCGPQSYFCLQCLVNVHYMANYFHSPEKWQDNVFLSVKLQIPVLKNPNHLQCPHAEMAYLKPLIVTDEKGFQHEYKVSCCGCKSEACTLVELGLWPATPTNPVMAFTFSLMEKLEKLFLVAKVSVKQFCESLPDFSNFPRTNVTISYVNGTDNKESLHQEIKIAHKPLEIYRNMLDAFEQFRHFKFDLRNMKMLCPDRDGENICPACPKKNGVLIESVDALFGLPRKKSSGTSVLPPERSGLLFAEQQVVDDFVDSYKDKNSNNDCHNFLAGSALRSNQRFAGLDETGIFGRACRHEFPKRFVNLKHGERISYAVWLIKDMVRRSKDNNLSYKLLYDISCILNRHLQNSEDFSDILNHIKLAIPIFHVYGHKAQCQIMYSPRCIIGFGLTDGEVMERMWSYMRGFCSITKEMSPSRRIDALTDCLLHYGRISKTKLGERLCRRMFRAEELQKTANATFTEMTGSVPDFNMCHIDVWINEEKEHYDHAENPVESASSWMEQYFARLRKFYCLRDESILQGTGDDSIMITEEMAKLEKKLVETERKWKLIRWKRSGTEYAKHMLAFYRKRLAQLENELVYSGREHKFLTNLKKKYADGQALSTRIERGIKKQSKSIRCSLKERDNICKLLCELGDPTAHIPYTFHDVVSSLLLERSHSECDESNSSTVPWQIKQQILDCYRLTERCQEERVLLESEMLNVIKFYFNDIKILQRVEQENISVGEMSFVMQEADQQKIQLAVLMKKFQKYVNLEEFVDEELQPYAHLVLDEPSGYSSSDNENYDTNESDDDDEY